MGNLWAAIIPLAVGGAASPELVAVSAFVLASHNRPKLRGALFVLGVAVSLAVALLVGALLGSHHTVARAPTHSTVRGIIDIALGVLVAAAGVYSIVRGTRHVTVPEHIEQPVTQARPRPLWRPLVAGLVVGVTDVKVFALCVAAAKIVSTASISLLDKLGMMATVEAIVLLPVAVPLALYIAAPNSAARTLSATTTWIHKYGSYIGAAICFLISAYLVLRGISFLG